MPKNDRRPTSAAKLAERITGASSAATRLPIVSAYLDANPTDATEIAARFERAASRRDSSPAATRELELLRAEVVSRAQTRYALDAAPAAQVRVRDALAEYLREPTPRR